ncbi:MAG: O-antigen ligase family protein [Candidatus Marinimicrobia bacterium]|nr:O-antigen ligase family protein [Candidatus Neomarinimicrobiota bacterium]
MKDLIGKYYSLAVLCSLPIFTVYLWSDQLVNGRYTAKTFYFYFCSAIVFIVLSVIALFKKSRVRIKITKLDLALLIYYFYNFIRILFTPDKPVYNTRFICYTLLIGLYFIWKYLFEIQSENRFGITPGKILVTALLITGAGQAVWGFLQIYNVIPVPPNIGGFRVFGNFGNPAPYASFLGPFAALGFGIYLLPKVQKPFDNILKNLGLVTLLLCLLVLPVTKSRSAWLGAFTGCLLILIYRYELLHKAKYLFNNRWKKSAAVLMLLVIVLFGSSALYHFKLESAYGRLLQWKITADMILDKPVFGHGFDSYGLHYNTYQADYFLHGYGTEQEKMVAGNTKQAHNEFFEITAELGIVGLFLGLGILLPVILSLFNRNQKERVYFIIGVSGLCGYLIESFFTYPLQILPSLIVFVFLMSIVSANSVGIGRIQPNRSVIAISTIIIIAIMAVFTVDQIRNYDIHKKWNRANQYSGMQWYENSEKIYAEIYPYLESNGDFLLNYGGTLALNRKPKEAISLLKKAEKYLNDPNLYLSLGNCYKEVGNFQKSEYYYQKAGAIVPHQMYPKYLLVKLYEKYQRNEQMLDLAEKISEMAVKIPSVAVTQIKREIDIILEKNDCNFTPR